MSSTTVSLLYRHNETGLAVFVVYQRCWLLYRSEERRPSAPSGVLRDGDRCQHGGPEDDGLLAESGRG